MQNTVVKSENPASAIKDQNVLRNSKKIIQTYDSYQLKYILV